MELGMRAHAEQLLLACSLNDVDTAMQLLEAIEKEEDSQLRELAVNISDVNGQTPLLHASKHCASFLTPRLLDLGADPAAFVRPSLNSCLHLAALHSPSQGQASVAKMLIQRGGCFVDAPNANGDTPLMFACGAGNVGTAALLLKAGANPAARNKHGLSCLMVAAGAGLELAVGLCLRALAAARQQGDVTNEAGAQAVQAPVQATHAALHHTDDQGNSALHFSARNGHASCVQALLAAGANPSLRNHAGRTPLVEAKLTRSSACMELLESSLSHPPNQALLDWEYPQQQQQQQQQQQRQRQQQQRKQKQQLKAKRRTSPSTLSPKASNNNTLDASGCNSQLQSPDSHPQSPGLGSSVEHMAAQDADEAREHSFLLHAAEAEAGAGSLNVGRADFAHEDPDYIEGDNVAKHSSGNSSQATGEQEDDDPVRGWVQVSSSGKKGRSGSPGQVTHSKTPGSASTAPGRNSTTPESNSTAPRSSSTAPRTNNTAPGSNSTASRSNSTAPWSNSMASRSNNTAPGSHSTWDPPRMKRGEVAAQNGSAAASGSCFPAAAHPVRNEGQAQQQQHDDSQLQEVHHRHRHRHHQGQQQPDNRHAVHEKQKQSRGLWMTEEQQPDNKRAAHGKQKQSRGVLIVEQQQPGNKHAAQQRQHATQQQGTDQGNGVPGCLDLERGHPQAVLPALASAPDCHSWDGSMDDADLTWIPQFQAFVQDACPQASSLAVLPHHLACVGIEGLSFSQLEALEVLHHSALARIAEAKLELARVQERLKSSEKSRLEEELKCRKLQLESMQAHAANSIPCD